MCFSKIFQINNFLPNKLFKTSIFEPIVIDLFRRYSIYYVTAFLLIIVGLVLLLVLPKGGLVLFLDANSTPALDVIFNWLTKGGEHYMGIVVLLLLLAFVPRRYIMIYAVSIVLSLLVSQGLKHQVFPNEGRPSSVHTKLHDIDGLERHANNSFPSGHTTAAFTFFTLLAISLRKKWVQFVAPIFAASVGVSRVYLGQHYLSDIVAGAVLGIFIVSIVVYVFDRKFPVRG